MTTEPTTRLSTIERTVRLAATVDSLNEAWLFVLAHLTEVGSRPNIEIKTISELETKAAAGDRDTGDPAPPNHAWVDRYTVVLAGKPLL